MIQEQRPPQFTVGAQDFSSDFIWSLVWVMALSTFAEVDEFAALLTGYQVHFSVNTLDSFFAG